MGCYIKFVYVFIYIKFRGGQPDNMYKLTYPNGKFQCPVFWAGQGAEPPKNVGQNPAKILKEMIF